MPTECRGCSSESDAAVYLGAEGHGESSAAIGIRGVGQGEVNAAV